MNKDRREIGIPLVGEYVLRNSLRKIVEASQPDSNHGLPHLDTAWSYGEPLWSFYGKETPKRLTMAAIYLHDISKPDFKPSSEIERRKTSANIASELLGIWGWPKQQVETVTQAILDHDQPKLIPRNIVGKILKDADVLAGLGSDGILRIVTKMVENGATVDYVIERLRKRMPLRIKGLYFPESKVVAQDKWEVVNQFLKDLKPSGVLTIKQARKRINDKTADRSDLII